MSEASSSGRLVWLWALVPLVVLLEVSLQWSIPRWEPSEEDWRSAARSVISQKQKDDLVVIAPAWATQGRMYLSEAITLEDFGRFGISRYDRVIEVSAGGASAPETDGLHLESEEEHGKLTVRRYRTGGKADVVYDFTENWRSARCVGSGCISRRLVIDHWFNPRLVFPVALKSTIVTAIFEDVPLGDLIWGHGIVGYREGRFDKGGPVVFKVYVDGKLVGEQLIKNLGPLETFEFPVKGEGTATVKFDVKTSGGNYKREFGFAAEMRRGRP